MDPLVVPGIVDSLGAIRDYVRAAAIRAGLDESRAYGLVLAADELATNTVVHGYQENDMTGDIAVRIERTDEELSVVLTDTAPAFDPRSLATPEAADLAKPLDERQIGGLGVFLSLQEVDRLDYERAQDANCVTLRMELGQGRPDTSPTS